MGFKLKAYIPEKNPKTTEGKEGILTAYPGPLGRRTPGLVATQYPKREHHESIKVRRHLGKFDLSEWGEMTSFLVIVEDMRRRDARRDALWARNHGYVHDNGMAILDLDSGGPARILAWRLVRSPFLSEVSI